MGNVNPFEAEYFSTIITSLAYDWSESPLQIYCKYSVSWQNILPPSPQNMDRSSLRVIDNITRPLNLLTRFKYQSNMPPGGLRAFDPILYSIGCARLIALENLPRRRLIFVAVQ